MLERARELGLENVRVLHAPAEESLGSCLNRLVDAASGEVVAKMDDDDLYGPNYLSDQLHALDYSGADVVGKQAHHMYLEAQDLTIVRFPEREHRFTDFVMGPTIVTRREVARAHPFADLGRGEDTDFLRRVAADGLSIYSATASTSSRCATAGPTTRGRRAPPRCSRTPGSTPTAGR